MKICINSLQLKVALRSCIAQASKHRCLLKCDPNRWLKERCGRKSSATTVGTECPGKVTRYRMLGDGKLTIKLKHNEIYKH